jgi:hypothetical protein
VGAGSELASRLGLLASSCCEDQSLFAPVLSFRALPTSLVTDLGAGGCEVRDGGEVLPLKLEADEEELMEACSSWYCSRRFLWSASALRARSALMLFFAK